MYVFVTLIIAVLYIYKYKTSIYNVDGLAGYSFYIRWRDNLYKFSTPKAVGNDIKAVFHHLMDQGNILN